MMETRHKTTNTKKENWRENLNNRSDEQYKIQRKTE